MVNNTQRIDRLEGEIRALPRLLNSEMERIRSELNLTSQNLSTQIHTITQNHGTLATEMTTLSQTIQALSDKLTNPDILNPLIQTNPPIPNQNNTTPNINMVDFSQFEGETEPHPVNRDDEGGN